MDNKSQKVLDKIVGKVKESIKHIDKDEMRVLMLKQYMTMHLIDEQHKWCSSRLESLSDEFLPSDMTAERAALFIDEIVAANSKNEAFMHFLMKIEGREFPYLSKKVSEEGKEILPDVFAYAYALQQLTKYSVKDYTFLEEIHNQFSTSRKQLGSFKELPLFHKIKLISVVKPINNYLEIHKSRKIKATSGGIAVKINILEAAWTDYKSGQKNNAKAGGILAKNRSGHKKYNEKTGAGPSSFSDDGRIIQRKFPFPAKWADLYQVWNLSFCLRFQDFVYVIPKLLIPQVANYTETPENYIYNRAIALYYYLNFASFAYVDKKKKNESTIMWHDNDLAQAFGSSNLEMAQEYQDLVDRNSTKQTT